MIQLANLGKIMWACAARSCSLSSLKPRQHEACCVGRPTLPPRAGRLSRRGPADSPAVGRPTLPPWAGQWTLDQDCGISFCSLVLGNSPDSLFKLHPAAQVYQELIHNLASFFHSFSLFLNLFWTQRRKRRKSAIYWLSLQCPNI